jgi:hypothetical protein
MKLSKDLLLALQEVSILKRQRIRKCLNGRDSPPLFAFPHMFLPLFSPFFLYQQYAV